MDKMSTYTSISKSEEGWKEVKTVESLIDDEKDVKRRKQLATVTLNKLNNVWIKLLKGNKLKISTKVKSYKSLMKSILRYSISSKHVHLP